MVPMGTRQQNDQWNKPQIKPANSELAGKGPTAELVAQSHAQKQICGEDKNSRFVFSIKVHSGTLPWQWEFESREIPT